MNRVWTQTLLLLTSIPGGEALIDPTWSPGRLDPFREFDPTDDEDGRSGRRWPNRTRGESEDRLAKAEAKRARRLARNKAKEGV